MRQVVNHQELHYWSLVDKPLRNTIIQFGTYAFVGLATGISYLVIGDGIGAVCFMLGFVFLLMTLSALQTYNYRKDMLSREVRMPMRFELGAIRNGLDANNIPYKELAGHKWTQRPGVKLSKVFVLEHENITIEVERPTPKGRTVINIGPWNESTEFYIRDIAKAIEISLMNEIRGDEDCTADV